MLISLIKKTFKNGKENPVKAEDLNTMQNNIETAINNAAGFVAKDADAYSASATYAIGALVVYSNKLYRCKTAITTAEAWNSAKWEQVYLKDLVTNLQTNMGNVGTLLDTINGEVI